MRHHERNYAEPGASVLKLATAVIIVVLLGSLSGTNARGQIAATSSAGEGTQSGDTYLPWEGGASYYVSWPNGPDPSGDTNFFPISVWLQDPSDAPRYQAIGVNQYIGLWQGPTQAQLSQLAAAGIPTFADQNHVALTSRDNFILRAWTQMDEPDNAQPSGTGYGPCVSPSTIIARYKTMKANDSTRPVFLNVGHTVADPLLSDRGVCSGHLADYPLYFQGADIVSYDVYPINSGLPLWYVANGMDNVRVFANYQKPAYQWIETTRISGPPKPTPAQVKSEAWMTIIHGALGIGYFCHSFYPKEDDHALLDDPEMSRAVAAINQQVTSLAPVLNTPPVANGVTVVSLNPNTPIDKMLKRWAGSTYLFTVAARPGGPTTAYFTLRGAPEHLTAQVLGESRKIAITKGSFYDDFAGSYQVHIYQIPFVPE